ncbi:FAD-dependent oxidoreductase [Fodinicola acaciae]|uniref:FAD-dependent oxidoreductase n=1 Tax=Fodinicola acaciae TaxID=2681555 RepID=UPI0013D7BA57|nr:FAD-dependent oxidoreductase [Fodinicola acaciae]
MVVGAGIVGLTTAVRLLEAGHRVRVLAADPPERSTSNLAAAIWYPTGFGPRAGVLDWAATAFATYREMAAAGVPGVVMRDSRQLLRARPDGQPWWAAAVGGVEVLTGGQPPYAGAYRFSVPLVEMPVHLRWLVGWFHRLGGTIERRRLASLDELDGLASVIVNCTGLGARELCADDSVHPVRGQVVRVANPGLTESVRDEQHPAGRAYVHPRSDDCILGGTADADAWDTAPDPAVTAAIVKRCTEIVPRLAGCAILGVHVGLRPARPSVRLEVDPRRDTMLIHNYGHSGAGITLGWGCAATVRALVDPTDDGAGPGRPAAGAPAEHRRRQ